MQRNDKMTNTKLYDLEERTFQFAKAVFPRSHALRGNALWTLCVLKTISHDKARRRIGTQSVLDNVPTQSVGTRGKGCQFGACDL